jgi:Fur family ferric uptake transcriptional regulator
MRGVIWKRNFVAILSFMFVNFQEQAEAMIRRTGDRATSGRVRILAILLAEHRAITHHEIEKRLSGEHRPDRVTLYRVLEWLNEKYFVHRVLSDDRVWRFRASVDAHPHHHAHFECKRCTRVICLDDLKARPSTMVHCLPVTDLRKSN